jgi:hypothetical protein
VLEARLSVIETNCRLAEEEKRACGEEYNNQVGLNFHSLLLKRTQITKLEHAHRQEVEALKLDLEEKLQASLATCEEKVRLRLSSFYLIPSLRFVRLASYRLQSNLSDEISL